MWFTAILPQDLRTTASPTFYELTLTAPTSCNYKFANINPGRLMLQCQTSGETAQLRLLPKDGDTTDNVFYAAQGYGLDSTNFEALFFGWNSGGGYYGIWSGSGGTGSARPLNFFSSTANINQLYLNTAGNVGINTNTPTYQLDVNGTFRCVDTSILEGNVTIGAGSAGIDYTLTFDGETNDGIITWWEDEDYFGFADDLLIATGENIYFRDTAIGITSNNDGYLDLSADTNVRTSAFIRHTSANYRRYYHLAAGSFDPGVSGAVWKDADANSLSGWQITDANNGTLRFDADIHPDWDGVSDMKMEVTFSLNAAFNNNDTVDLVLDSYYNSDGDTATKSQSETVITTTDGTQYKVYTAEFTINYDETDNNVDSTDRFSFLLSLDEAGSEVDNLVIHHITFYYNTTHVGIESGDV